jgi:uncharacterized protein YdeI (YjbR/CyaY-like superfamily)
MTEFGMSEIEAARQSGLWERDPRSEINFDMPGEFSGALEKNKRAKDYFANLSATYQKQYIGWVVTAKRPETREKRIQESVRLLEQGKKLGLK